MTLEMILEIGAVVLAAVTVVLLLCLLWQAARQNRDKRQALSYEQLRAELGEQDRQTMQRLSLLKQEVDTSLKNANQLMAENIGQMTQVIDRRLSGMQQTMETRIQSLQDDNAKKLDSMRETVNEKLTSTLETRLGESFKTVNDQLEKVYKGLGDMQSLAVGVGDLKKVLTNVKTRGTWGEISLGNLLEQVLSPQQYRANVKVAPRRNEIVEYAICLPGREDGQDTVYLPIDSKFPVESYIRLVEASEIGALPELEAASKQLEASIKESARSIRDKYIVPPYTTDFAIMFLPTEGLYAEVTKRVELCTVLQRDYRVTIMGPTTLGAFLNSLQMGFKTLAIQKRSGEVWKMLGAIKVDFGRFGTVLEATQKKLAEATDNLGKAAKRTEIIQNKLKSVEELPETEACDLLGTPIPLTPEE